MSIISKDVFLNTFILFKLLLLFFFSFLFLLSHFGQTEKKLMGKDFYFLDLFAKVKFGVCTRHQRYSRPVLFPFFLFLIVTFHCVALRQTIAVKENSKHTQKNKIFTSLFKLTTA
jgi:hypothetical protein